jgi:hypothetical protein
MKMSLRVRLLGTIVGAIVVFFIISVVAARWTLQRDLLAQGNAQVTAGGSAFGGYWDSRKEQIRLLITQDAVADALRKAVQSHNVQALQDQLSTDARTSGLSFLTIVDNKGKVLARANGPVPGSLANNTFIQRALTGETVSTAAILLPGQLQGEGLAPQATSDITGAGAAQPCKSASNDCAEHLNKGLAIVGAAPMSDSNERTIGVIYGGVLMNHLYELVDQTSQALLGSSALLDGDAIIASTILAPDGTRVVDQQDSNFSSLSSGQGWTGLDKQGGVQYLAHLDPIQNDQNQVIGARWYGIPMSQITDIINNTTRSLVLWGVLAMIIALALSIPIVERLSNTLAQRSKQISGAARELGVTIVGSEVSGDHVAATRAAVERNGRLIDELATGGDAAGKVKELKEVQEEISNDMIVIDTLSQEMSKRMTQAVDRVRELKDVADGLNTLVTGEAS